MGTKIIYDGPEGNVNREIGRQNEGGDLLVPGTVYEVDADTALRIVGGERDGQTYVSTAGFSRVNDLNDDLTVAQLKSIAAEHGIEGRSKMSRDQLVEAIRSSRDSSSSSDASRDAAATTDPDIGSTTGPTPDAVPGDRTEGDQ